MVICKYFMNGNCRFGSKCVNEHLDVKQLVKSDVESAINGNQWPLSCFGPFKEKPSIPSFIEDQSFEEIRFLCYGAKKQNFFDNFAQQFNKEVIDAKNKMKMLLTLNKEVIDVVVNLYNANEPPKGIQNQQNPFAAANQQQNVGANLFGTPTTTAANPFGASANVGAGRGSIFGGAQKPVLGQSAFGSFSTHQQQPNTNLFSSPQTPAQKPSAFGGNLFSQAAQQNPVGGGSIFGGAQQQQTQAFGASNTSIFGQQTNAGGLFGQAAAQPQQATLGGGNIFAQAAAAQPQQQPTSGFGLFSQPVQQQQQQPQQPPPPFGAQITQQSPFGAAQPQPAQQNSFFGQMQSQQQQQPSAGLFGAQMQQQPQQVPQQPFGQQQQQPQQQTGLFASASAATPFGQTQPQQPQQQTNIFAQAAAGFQQQPQQPQQLQQQFQVQSAVAGDRTYSKMENLTPEEIEAFKADTFELGKIPFSPPPRELVN